MVARSEFQGANFLNFSRGSAIRQVCDMDGCPYSTILAAIDPAVVDDADILLMSLENDDNDKMGVPTGLLAHQL